MEVIQEEAEFKSVLKLCTTDSLGKLCAVCAIVPIDSSIRVKSVCFPVLLCYYRNDG